MNNELASLISEFTMTKINDLPTEINKMIGSYLNQEQTIRELTMTIQFLRNKVSSLKRTNQLKTLQIIQLTDDIRNLEHALANDENIERRLSFESSDEDDIIEMWDIEIDGELTPGH